MKQARQIFRDAILLTAASLLMRTVGVAFQVAVSNRAGAEVMGLYSLMMGVYGFALTLATSGIHLGVTRLVARYLSYNQTKRIKGIVKTACIYAVTCGTLAAGLLLLFAEPIGIRLLSDARTVPSLRLFAISLPFISLSSVFGGYFTAVRRSYKNAGVQITEQLVKIGLTMYLFSSFFTKNAEKMLCALVLGGVGAEIFSFLLSAILYLADKQKRSTAEKAPPCGGRALLQNTVPIALTSYVRSALLAIQNAIIPRGLKKSGASHAAALVSYGCIHSMALPVVLYPAALISSFSGLLIPTMAECHAQNRQMQIKYIVSRVWFFSMLFSVGTAGILICFSEEFGAHLYPNSDAGRYIRLLAPLIPIMYLDTATDAMLKGLGEHVYSMKINILDALISVILVWILTPRYGANGYLVAIYVSELFNTVFSVTRLLSVSRVSPKLLKWVYLPLFCILAATYLTRHILRMTPQDTSRFPILPCVITGVLYLLLLLLTRTVNREELRWGKSLLILKEEPEITKTTV